MKYLVLLVVLIVAFGIWRSRRLPETNSSPPPLVLPQDMLACARCGMHVPQAEALMTGKLAYCCAEHQQLGPA